PHLKLAQLQVRHAGQLVANLPLRVVAHLPVGEIARHADGRGRGQEDRQHPAGDALVIRIRGHDMLQTDGIQPAGGTATGLSPRVPAWQASLRVYMGAWAKSVRPAAVIRLRAVSRCGCDPPRALAGLRAGPLN